MLQRAANLLLLVGALLFCLLFLEVGLRLGGRPVLLNSRVELDRELGWVHTRGLVERVGSPALRINSLGFRGPERELAKPPETRRVVVVGDSFTAANQVDYELTYIRRLETLLTEGTSGTWEVMNFGVDGYGTAQEWLAIQRYGLRFDPDVVVLQVFPANDVCNNSVAGAGWCALGVMDAYRPYFTRGSRQLRPTHAQPLRAGLRRSLVSFAAVEHAVLTLEARWRFGIGRAFDGREYRLQLAMDRIARAKERFSFAAPPQWFAFAPHEEQIGLIVDGWAVTESLIEEISVRLEELGIALVVLVIPKDVQVTPELWRQRMEELPTAGRPTLIRDYPEARLGPFLAEREIPAVLLLEEFEASQDSVLPYRTGHLNPAAHQLTAEKLLRALVDEGVVDTPTDPDGPPVPAE